MASKRDHHLADHLAYPPRALRADRAAAYLDISPSLFHELVNEGVLPKGTKVPGHEAISWDRLDLDAAYDDWKAAQAETGNSFDRLFLKQGK